MKPILRLACLLTLCAIMFSCKKETKTNPENDRMNELAEKYHLKKVESAASISGRNFSSLEEFEAFLKNTKNNITVKANAKVEKQKTTNATTYLPPGQMYASFEFDEYKTDVVPDLLYLSWDGIYQAYSYVNYSSWHQNYPNVGWHYDHTDGYMSSQNSIRAQGAYLEYYTVLGHLWERRYRVDISANINYPEATAWMTFIW